MTTDIQIALAKTRSMKVTVANAVGELGMRSEAAFNTGNASLGNKLERQAIELARQVIELRRTEDRIRAATGLTPAITELDKIASDARKALGRLERTSDALAEAAKLATILANLAGVLT